VEFKPQHLKYIDSPKEFFSNNTVCIVNINNCQLAVNDILFVEKDGKFSKATILEIKQNNKSVNTADNGELGLKLNSQIKKNSKLWKKELVQ